MVRNQGCEALVAVASTWSRCWKTPTETHHMLTRSRGGLILDAAGETAHLIRLCRQHHQYAHSPGGHEAGLMIDGYVTTGTDGSAVYQGSDERLLHLRPMDLPKVSEVVSRQQPGQRL